MDCKKIAIITAGFAPVPAVNGGAVERLTTILLEQNTKERIFDIDVYTVYDKKIEDAAYSGAEIIKVKVSALEREIEKNMNRILRRMKLNKNCLRYRVKAYREYKRRVEKKHYEYVIFENAREMMPWILKGGKKGAKFFLHLHNDSSSVSLDKSLDLLAARKMDGVIAVSGYIKGAFEAATAAKPGKVKVLYNCASGPGKSVSGNNVKKKGLGIKADDFVFLYVGRINYEKGVHVLAEAFGKMKAPNAKLIICGGTWGGEFVENRYLAKIRRLLGDNLRNVAFTGHIAENALPEYYSMCDVVIIPSVVQEAFGMVLLEAALRKKPCIVTRSGGMREIVSERHAYWLDLDGTLVDKMKAAMYEVMDSYSHYQMLAEQAYRDVIDRPEFQAEGYLKRFSDLISEFEGKKELAEAANEELR